MVRPLVVSRKLALRMNSDRGDYLVCEVGSKENLQTVFRGVQ
jgi:hypothetical protein